MPPRSRLWAKELRLQLDSPDNSRVRLLVTARRAASSPRQRAKPFCLGSAIRVFHPLSKAFKSFVGHTFGRVPVGAASTLARFSLASPTFWEASSCRPRRPGAAHHRAGVQIHRVLGLVGQMRRPSFILAILASGSLFETQSSLESFHAPGPWASRCRSPGPGAPASPGSLHPCRAARCCDAALASMVDIHPVALHQTRLDQGQNPVEDRRVDFMGQARAGLRSQEWSL